jgi:hypothetical protein
VNLIDRMTHTLLNVEIAPAPAIDQPVPSSILEVQPGGWLFHANKYQRVKVEEQVGGAAGREVQA